MFVFPSLLHNIEGKPWEKNVYRNRFFFLQTKPSDAAGEKRENCHAVTTKLKILIVLLFGMLWNVLYANISDKEQ